MVKQYSLIAPGHGGIFDITQHQGIAIQGCEYSVGVFAKLSDTKCFAAHIVAHNPILKSTRATPSGHDTTMEDGYRATAGPAVSLEAPVREAVAESLRAAGIEVDRHTNIRVHVTKPEHVTIVSSKLVDDRKQPLIPLVVSKIVLQALRSPINHGYERHISTSVAGTWVEQPVPQDGFGWISSSIFEKENLFFDPTEAQNRGINYRVRERLEDEGWQAVPWQGTAPSFSFAWQRRDPEDEKGPCWWKGGAALPT